jgi:hypothetical protein
MGKLNTYVHVVEVDDDGMQTGKAGTFGPADELPDWAAKAITNPDVWADDDSPRTLTPVEAERVVADKPPTSGAGSGRDAWAAYATGQGVTVTDDMDRAAIIAAVDGK